MAGPIDIKSGRVSGVARGTLAARRDRSSESGAKSGSGPRSTRPGLRSTKAIGGLAIPLWLPLGGLAAISVVETARIDGPHREIFFNVDNFWVLYGLLPIVAVILTYGILRRSRV